MGSAAEANLARAWIAAQDDLEDLARIDAVRVAADRLQVEGHPLGELVTLGLALLDAGDEKLREDLKRDHAARVAALLPEALGPFASLMTHPKVFDLRWSLCYLESARLPLAKAHRYAGLLGRTQLDPGSMVALFLEQPAARCIRSLTCQFGTAAAGYRAVVDAIADSGAPLETVVLEGQFPDADATAELAAMSRLHTFRPGLEAMPLPGGDPDVVWIGDASSIRALGRAATSSDPITRTQALERIAGLGRNRARYQSAGLADAIGSERRTRMDRHDPLLGYLRRATSLEWQRAQFENRDRNPYVPLEPKHWLVGVFHTIVPSGYWHPTTAFERLLRDHSRRVVTLPIVRSSDDLSSQPEWVEFRAHAELIRSQLPR